MNYAHYLTYPFHVKRQPEAFALFIADASEIILNAPEGAELCGPNHAGQPLINNSMLTIGSTTNLGPFSLLSISIDQAWPSHRYPMMMVRTDRHVYDSVVCACLLAFHHHFPTSQITTDGTAKDWTMGISLYEYAAQRLAPIIDFHNEQ